MLAMIGLSMSCSRKVAQNQTFESVDPWKGLDKILKQIKAPTFPNTDFVVTQYGAVADGKTDCTEAFRKAIDECNKAGGGRVVVPAGNFYTGPIHLKSNVNLHVAKKCKSSVLYKT